ncbi:unnamed protein product [Kuraishia capsulata CBS 1993]|uniref:Ras-GEF domain-containing protein n=1 Tax=Kuraishia capsulata CBS 1993 TaxID=1382522 RepID=W6MNJ8_9ASCO|nr:uncharacterized protein KUCA_T00003832001 [Kuraishia capsulata CBS 1993]CDK27853.1 unnamed protein product [Kuraishia capsulata CBS 1993]
MPGTNSSSRIAEMASMFDQPAFFPFPKNGDQLQLSDVTGQLVSGTAPAMVCQLTSPDTIDYEFLLDFFMTYREFIGEHFLLELLLSRFEWSLRKDDQADTATVRQLVTVRTFVTIRHWLLNYFQDDFVENVMLRREFVNFMNRLSEDEVLLKDPQSIASRCLIDLKKAYIRLCNIFWLTTELEKFDTVDFGRLKLSVHDDMVRLSVIGLKQMTNPARRRSGLLSLYDQQSSSATNLLLREHAQQRTGSYQSVKPKQRLPPVSRTFKKHQLQPMLHPKDSLLTLNKSRRRLNDNSLHVKGFNRLSGKWDGQTTTTRGEVQVFEDSQVKTYAPGTPLKKINYEPLQQIRSVDINVKKRTLFRFKSKSKRQTSTPVNPQPLASALPVTPKRQKPADIIQLGNDRIDLLSAQVIDEFESLLKDSNMRNRLSEHLMNGRKTSRSSAFSLFMPNQKPVELQETVHETSTSYEDNQSVTSSQLLDGFNNRLSQNEAEEADEADESGDTFKSPSVTMNWSNSLDLSNESRGEFAAAGDIIPTEDETGEDIAQIQSLKLESEPESDENALRTFNPPIESEAESDEEDFMSSFEEQPDEISLVEIEGTPESELINQLDHEPLENRFSVRIISEQSQSSLRSYVSYDSDMSMNAHGKEDKGKNGYALLRKKTSFSDLRNFQSQDSISSVVNSWDELPFCNVDLEDDFDDNEIDLPDFGDDVSMFSSTHSSSFVLPYPGFSSRALAELAAIPDEPTMVNPIEAALLKLEGKQVETAQVIYGLNDEMDSMNLETADSTSAVSSPNEEKLQEKVRDLFIQRNPALPSLSNDEDHTLGDAKFRLSQQDLNKLTRENLTIEKVMKGGLHISFILCYDSKLLAQHFTQIEKDALQEIDWSELVEMKWNQEVKPINSWLNLLNNELENVAAPGVNLVISRFNLMSNWIVSEILLTKDKAERVMTISRFIHIGHHCKELQNYSTMIQITLALSSSKISNLKETWKDVQAGDLLLLKSLKDLTSPFRNFHNLRQEIDKCVVSKGVVPFVGLYLADLTFNQEKPSFKNSTTGIVAPEDFTTIINFDKFRMQAKIVKALIRLIELSKLYEFKIVNDILSKCIYIKSLTEEQMEYCTSQLVDP